MCSNPSQIDYPLNDTACRECFWWLQLSVVSKLKHIKRWMVLTLTVSWHITIFPLRKVKRPAVCSPASTVVSRSPWGLRGGGKLPLRHRFSSTIFQFHVWNWITWDPIWFRSPRGVVLIREQWAIMYALFAELLWLSQKPWQDVFLKKEKEVELPLCVHDTDWQLFTFHKGFWRVLCSIVTYDYMRAPWRTARWVGNVDPLYPVSFFRQCLQMWI